MLDIYIYVNDYVRNLYEDTMLQCGSSRFDRNLNTKVVPKRISKVIRFSVEFVSSRTKRVEKLQLLEKSKL